MTIEDFKETFLKIDKFSLDSAWMEQAAKFMDIAEMCNAAKLEVDEKKEMLEAVLGRKNVDIREFPEKYSLSFSSQRGQGFPKVSLGHNTDFLVPPTE